MRKLVSFILLTYLTMGCTKDENVIVKENPPTVITKIATDVTLKIATLNGEVTDEGTTAASDRGFVLSDKNTNPSVSDTKAQSGYGKGVYSIVLEKLVANTKYYYKAYASNSKGTSYGDIQSFITADYKIPTVVTEEPKNITYSSAQLTGTISDDGGKDVTERGFCLSTTTLPTVSNIKIPNGNGLGTFSSVVIQLKEETLYFMRAYATNSKGTSYSKEISFKTLGVSTITTVISKTGRVWMDRNLGATKVATSLNDSASFGDYYQWGRLADGHEKRNSVTIGQPSLSDIPGHGFFIVGRDDWRLYENVLLWLGVNGTNNPCPNGFRLPTQQEWIEEFQTWNTTDPNGALNSPLKLPPAGIRSGSDGRFQYNNNSGGQAYYWSSTISQGGSKFFGYYKSKTGINTGIFESVRADGLCVRCIKD